MMKRILAMVGVILLVGLYVAALILAIFQSPLTMPFFIAAIASTVAIPLMIHLFMSLSNQRRGKSIWENPYSYRDKKDNEDKE